MGDLRVRLESPARRGACLAKPLMLLLASALLTVGVSALGRAQSPTEYEVKAVFLYNFAKFVEWPGVAGDAPNEPFVIGILGEDPFGKVLDETLRGKTVNGRTVVIARLLRAKDARGCHIVFISGSESRHLHSIFESLQGSNVLTVGETEGFARQGGAINFTLEESRVRFEINIEAAQRAGLKISSKLLSLAKIVRSAGSVGKS